jgi:hypothetical protein
MLSAAVVCCMPAGPLFRGATLKWFSCVLVVKSSVATPEQTREKATDRFQIPSIRSQISFTEIK